MRGRPVWDGNRLDRVISIWTQQYNMGIANEDVTVQRGGEASLEWSGSEQQYRIDETDTGLLYGEVNVNLIPGGRGAVTINIALLYLFIIKEFVAYLA